MLDVFGRDDELRSLHAFLDRPAAAGMAGPGAGGRGGDREVDDLAGKRRGRAGPVGCESFRRGPRKSSRVLPHAALGDLLEEGLPDVLDQLPAPRRRALESALLIEDAADEPVDVRTLAVAVRNALQLLAERGPILVAIDDVQWLDPSLGERPGVRREAIAGPRMSDCSSPGGSGTAFLPLGARACRRRPQAGAHTGRPAQRGCAPRNPAAESTRSAVRSADAAAPARGFGREYVLRARAGPCPRRGMVIRRSRCSSRSRWSRSSALASTRCRTPTRRALLLACTHGRLRPAQVDGDVLEAAFADNVIELADGVHPFTHPLLASVLYQAAFRVIGAAHTSSWPRSSTIRSRAPVIARLRSMSRTPRSPRNWRPRSSTPAIARGAPIAAAELGEHALRATPPERNRGSPPTSARHRSRAPCCRRGSASPRTRARASCRRAGGDGARRGAPPPLRARGSSARDRASRGGARPTRQGTPALEALLHWRLGSTRTPDEGDGVGSAPCARGGRPCRRARRRRAPRRGAVGSSPSFDSTAAIPDLPEKPSAPTSSPSAPGDRQQVQPGRIHARPRPLLPRPSPSARVICWKLDHRRWRDKDERSAAHRALVSGARRVARRVGGCGLSPPRRERVP